MPLSKSSLLLQGAVNFAATTVRATDAVLQLVSVEKLPWVHFLTHFLFIISSSSAQMGVTGFVIVISDVVLAILGFWHFVPISFRSVSQSL
jgi:hypothetical protein